MSSDKEIHDAISQCLADSPPAIVPLQIKSQFQQLSPKQKLYAHHIARASFLGTRIILRQVSYESETIYDLILSLYHACSGEWKELQKQAGVSDVELRQFLEYAAQFLGNLSNYKSFGDSKFIPRLSQTSFENLVKPIPKAKELFHRLQNGDFNSIWLDTEHLGKMLLGYPDENHLSTYYPDSPDITKGEIEAVSKITEEKGLLPENTRLRKTPERFELLVASSNERPSKKIDTSDGNTEYGPFSKLGNKKLNIVYGDHKEEMGKIALHIKKAALYSDNETQHSMLDHYAESFDTGSLKAFKESQKLWVKDMSPAVETNIGFIETMRDPAGIRAEWEGFVAVVNKERTKAFEKLVNIATDMIPLLPWTNDFERDFQAPDFTSLDVLAFATSGLPAGINIPNDDQIRQSLGFKNVSLANVLGAKAPNEPVPFIHKADLDTYNKYRDDAFEVQVAVHELLGHGSGKLLQETSPGHFNFSSESPPVSPITGKPISTYYLPGQTWSSVFGPIASSYEECRAECIAMALCPEPRILSIFGHGDGSDNLPGSAADVLYVSYLSMARAGVAALEYWNPKSRKWGQAHMQARFSILRVFLAAKGPGGEKFAWLEHTEHKNEDLEDGAGAGGEWEGLVVRVRRELIPSVGRKAVEAYLQKLHVLKATADVDAGRGLYTDMTDVNEEFATKVRPAVLKAKMPRKVYVQANTILNEDGTVELKEYEPTLEGMIQSWAERDV